MRVALVAEELRAPAAQPHDFLDDLLVVALVAVVAAAHERLPDFLAQVTAPGIGEERLDARARVEDRPPAGLAAFLRGFCRRLAQRIGQALEVRFALEDERGVLVGQHVLAELGVERGEPLVDGGELLLRFGVQLRATAREFLVAQPRESLLLGVQAGFLARAVHGGDALEELLVLDDPVAKRGELRLHLALDLLEIGRAHRRAEDAVDVADAIEHPAGLLHRFDRVGEGGRRRFAGDAVHLAQLLAHRGLERGLEVRDLHLVERRDAAVGTGPFRDEGIRHGFSWTLARESFWARRASR